VHPPKAASQAPCYALRTPAPSLATGHSRNRKQNPRSPCLGRVSHLPPSHSLPPRPSSPHAGTLQGCPSAPMPWHRGPHGTSTQPRLQHSCTTGGCGLASGNGAWHLPRHLQPCDPFPVPKGNPRLVWHSPAVPSGCLGRDGRALLGLSWMAKSPPWSGVGLPSQSSFSPRLTGRQCSPAPLLCPAVNTWL